MEKENNTNESDFGENEMLDLNSLKSFEVESKANIGDINRSSHRRCSLKKSVLRNFAKFTGKHLRPSLFLIKLQD